MRHALDRLAALGPYFAVRCGDRPDGDGFRPLAELYGDGLGPYVADVGRRMRTDQPRVAASTAQFGIASRLWSLALGSAALGGRVPDLSPHALWWRYPPSGSFELWLPGPRALPGAPAEALRASVLESNLRVLDAALRERHGLSPQVLRGNTASALVGALRVLTDRAPDAPFRPAPLVEELLGTDPLSGSGTFVHEDGLGSYFARRSCCLYYRVPGGGICGDCVLRTRPRP
ncbi:(2Fe-2S)-binding protein [Streptomyces sp. HB2AG]|uniref:(2Fe-2S)-binding protein n=1 Tax=Streptomyces sp. HB2AG TaxID=2983400 RepID=UPI0022AA63D4|nr:(2Fe-2S)-binding protein [Streptomyces sp. HB2AG]MCZ2523164.1 (2Fe-2S)-binding protein [Streptomyces sp. HB2AG]